MSVLSPEEQRRISNLGIAIRRNLSCETACAEPIIPCHTCRMEALREMMEYLEIHDYIVMPTPRRFINALKDK